MADATDREQASDGAEGAPREQAARVTRRGLLVGGAALAGSTTLLGGRTAWGGTTTAKSAAKGPAKGPGPGGTVGGPATKHATPLRGTDVVAVKGKEAEARFGLMFKKLPSHTPPDDLLRTLAEQMAEPAVVGPESDNPSVTSGYTFLGQFIDHDMTLDRTPLAQQDVDPHGLVNYDSPVFDLGSVYGRGPATDPQLYETDGRRLRVVRNAEGVDDLPRGGDGRAYLGDSRNDENLMVAQLHLLFLKFHNRLLSTGLAPTFAEAQRLTRWHFQWIIVHEFLPRVVGSDTVRRFLPDGATKVKREFYKPKGARPMMPLEHSAAAYRFGHSMVRGGYLMNVKGGVFNGAFTFGEEGADLRGSRPVPARFEIDWNLFFEVPGRSLDGPRNLAHLIDPKLTAPLFTLPPTVVDDLVVSLAERNLLRARRLGLPSGQDVARAMGVTPLTAAELALPDPANPGWGGGAPLWFYVLREAQVLAGGLRLGPIGGRIVAETILGILDSDKASYLSAKTPWLPAAPLTATPGQFTVGDFVRYAQGG